MSTASVRLLIKLILKLFSSFSLLAQRKRGKRKGSRSLAASLLVPDFAVLSCAVHKELTLRKVVKFILPRSLSLSCGVLRRIVLQFFIPLLGYAKWQKYIISFFPFFSICLLLSLILPENQPTADRRYSQYAQGSSVPQQEQS